MTKPDWNKTLSVVLRHEGGYTVDHAGDTYYGITLPTLQAMHALNSSGADFDGDGDADLDDLRMLTPARSADIYKRLWWDRYRYELFPTHALACKTCDLAVNMGAKQAHGLLQTACNNVLRSSVQVDGWIGPQTLDAIMQDPDDVLEVLCMRAAKFYHWLTERNQKKYGKFLSGWLRRAYDMEFS